MDNISILVAACVSALSVLGLVIKFLLSERKQPAISNGNGKVKQAEECSEEHKELQEKLMAGIQGFRENHLSEGIKIEQILEALRRVEANQSSFIDYLKKQ